VVDAANAQHATSLVAQNPLLQYEMAPWLLDCGAHEQQICAQSSKLEQASPSSFVPLPPVMSNVGHFPLDETALCGPFASGGPPMHVYALVPCPLDVHPTSAIATNALFMLASYRFRLAGRERRSWSTDHLEYSAHDAAAAGGFVSTKSPISRRTP